MYHKKLSKLAEYDVSIKKTIQPSDTPLLIYGCQDSYKSITLHNSFEAMFGYIKKMKVWYDIGALPFNRKCLQDDKVKHEIVSLYDSNVDVDSDYYPQN